MSGSLKAALVVGGYLVALLLTVAAGVLLLVIDTGRGSGGMQAFGDMLLLLGLFGFLCVFPTALALYFLRPVAVFWTVLAIASLAFASTGPLAAGLVPHLGSSDRSLVMLLGFLGLLRILGAPLVCLAFLTCAVFAPARRPRRAELVAAFLEGGVSIYVFVSLFVFHHWLL